MAGIVDIEWWNLLKDNIEHVGPLDSVLTYGGFIVTAGFLIVALLFGKAIVLPPFKKNEKALTARIYSLFCGAILAWLYIAESSSAGAVNLLPYSALGLVGGLLLFFIYMFAQGMLVFSCDVDPSQLYIRGLVINEKAKEQIEGNSTDPTRVTKAGKPPTNAKDLFCASGNQPGYVWELWSYETAKLILAALAFSVMSSLTLGLGSLAIELSGTSTPAGPSEPVDPAGNSEPSETVPG